MGKRRYDLDANDFWEVDSQGPGNVMVGIGSGVMDQDESRMITKLWLEQSFEWVMSFTESEDSRKGAHLWEPKCHLGQTACEVLSGHPSRYL